MNRTFKVNVFLCAAYSPGVTLQPTATQAYVHFLYAASGGYIVECLRLFGVVVEGPKGCLLLVRLSCDF